MKYPRVYIDNDGVERGYYVYAHRCTTTGTIFYVGKGKGNRAWSDQRSTAWKKHVEQIGNRYETVLLHKDLTEDESIDLERKEIDANGGPASQGGKLVNWISGEAGEGFGVAVRLEVSLQADPDDDYKTIGLECLSIYNEARRFKKLKRAEISMLGCLYERAVDKYMAPIEVIYWKDFESDHWSSPFLVMSAYTQDQDIEWLCRHVKNRKMKWSDFCERVDSAITGFRESIEREACRGEATNEIIVLASALSDAQVAWSTSYADGSFIDAERASTTYWIQNRFPLTPEGDAEFEKYVALTQQFFCTRKADAAVEIRNTLRNQLPPIQEAY